MTSSASNESTVFHDTHVACAEHVSIKSNNRWSFRLLKNGAFASLIGAFAKILPNGSLCSECASFHASLKFVLDILSRSNRQHSAPTERPRLSWLVFPILSHFISTSLTNYNHYIQDYIFAIRLAYLRIFPCLTTCTKVLIEKGVCFDSVLKEMSFFQYSACKYKSKYVVLKIAGVFRSTWLRWNNIASRRGLYLVLGRLCDLAAPSYSVPGEMKLLIILSFCVARSGRREQKVLQMNR